MADNGSKREQDQDITRRNLVGLFGAVAGASLLSACAADASQKGGGVATGQSGQALTQACTAASLYAAIQSLGGNAGTVVVGCQLPLRSSGDPTSVTVPSNVTLRFEDGGQILIDSTETLTVSGSIEAVPAPPNPLFDSGTSGLGTIKISFANTAQGQRLYANWFPGTDIADSWNLMVQSCFGSGGSWVGPRELALVGTHTVTKGLDAKGLSYLVLDFSGSFITFQMSTGAGLDLTGSTNMRVLNAQFTGTTTGATPPPIGILLCRGNSPLANECNEHELRGVSVAGYWQVAAIYNVGAEVNRHLGCCYTNSYSAGLYAGFFGNAPRSGDLNSGGFPDSNFAPPSASGQELFGTQFRFTNGTATDGTQAALCLYGFRDFVMDGAYIGSQNAPHVLVDARNAPVYGCQLTNLFTHRGTDPLQLPPNSIHVRGPASGQPQHVDAFRLHGLDLNADTHQMYVEGLVTMQHPVIELCDIAKQGLHCETTPSQVNLFNARISVNGVGSYTKKVELGDTFSGTISMGADQLESDGSASFVPATTMRGVVTFTKATMDQVRFYSPAQFGTSASPGRLGFYGTTPVGQPTVTGSTGGNAALDSLLTALENLGLIARA